MPKFDRSWVLAGKLLFILFAPLVLVTIHNSSVLPAAQFIYGRF